MWNLKLPESLSLARNLWIVSVKSPSLLYNQPYKDLGTKVAVDSVTFVVTLQAKNVICICKLHCKY